MHYFKKIVCLANSRKNSGRCVAGKELLSHGCGPWIRPISPRPSAEVSLKERRLANWKEPRVLDIIEIQMIAPAPSLYQSENHMIDVECCWQKSGEFPWTELQHIVDRPDKLWANGDSSYNGLNDRVKLDVASKLTNSLVLIEPSKLTVEVQMEGQEFGNPRRRVRASFRYQNSNYTLSVTDPMAARAFLAKPDNDYPLTDTYVCISLAEAYTDDYCYKLVAALISRQPL